MDKFKEKIKNINKNKVKKKVVKHKKIKKIKPILYINDIEGWLRQIVISFTQQINIIQNNNKIIGNVIEIGVHHGKFFIPLAILNKKYDNIAVDVFENQEENISNSGLGDFKIFKQHCIRNNIKNLKIIKDNSLNLTKNAFITENKVRLFSIDGGHFAKEVLNDLKLAEDSITSGGVIIVDDFQHPDWDDVFTSTLSYLKGKTNLKPFLMGGNKLFLCHKGCNLYNNLNNTLTIETYKSTFHKERQKIKSETAISLYPYLQLFEDY